MSKKMSNIPKLRFSEFREKELKVFNPFAQG